MLLFRYSGSWLSDLIRGETKFFRFLPSPSHVCLLAIDTILMVHGYFINSFVNCERV